MVVSSCYGGHSIEETPGSIPNPEAKLDCADGTALGRVWESRSPPDIFTGSGGVLEPLVWVFASSTPFFLRRKSPVGDHAVEMVQAENTCESVNA